MEELISVIIPVYKVERYLDRCVESIVNQTYTNLEIILVDDGSPDNCPKMCDAWAEKDNRIKVMHKTNGGVSSARNMALKVTQGAFIYFMDSDDSVELDTIEKAYKSIVSNGADLVIWGYKVIENEETKLVNEQQMLSVNLHDAECFLNLYNKNLLNALWNKLYRRELIKDSFDIELTWGEDLLFNLNYFKNAKKVNVLSDCMYNYYTFFNPNALTKMSAEKKFKQIQKLFMQKYNLINCQFKGMKNVLSAICIDLILAAKSYIKSMAIGVSYREVKSELRSILDCEEMRLCLRHYKAAGCKERVLLFLMKHKMSYFLYKMYKIKK